MLMNLKSLNEMILTLSDNSGDGAQRYSLRAHEVQKLKDFITADVQSGGLGRQSFNPGRSWTSNEKKDAKAAAKFEAIVDLLLEEGWASINQNDSWMPCPGAEGVFLTHKFSDLMNIVASKRKRAKVSSGGWTKEDVEEFLGSEALFKALKNDVFDPEEVNNLIKTKKQQFNASSKLFKELSDDPTYDGWFKEVSPTLSAAGKLEKFVRALESVRVSLGGSSYLVTVIDTVMDIPVDELVKDLFSLKLTNGVHQIPRSLRAVADINSYNAGGSAGHSIGRGEVVLPFLLDAEVGLGGKNTPYDAIVDGVPWEVKYVDASKRVRMGGNGYPGSNVQTALDSIADRGTWEGGSPMGAITRTMVESNSAQIAQAFGSLRRFQMALDAEMRIRAMHGVDGIVFMTAQYELNVVPKANCYCAGVGSGRYLATWIPGFFAG